MRRKTAVRRRWAAAITTTIVLSVTISGCAFDPAAIPVPGTTVSGDTYPLEIHFANVLNLPRGAKVMADGVEVGNLTGVEIRSPGRADEAGAGYVVAHVNIMESVRLPTGTTAELRQATPLGDVHIALATAVGTSSSVLMPGATIELAQTSQAPQIEDTMAALASAIGSGVVDSFQDIVRQLDAVLPEDPARTAHTFNVLGQNIEDIAADLASVDNLLDGMIATTDVFVENREKLNVMLTDDGRDHVVSVFDSVLQIIVITTLLGPIARNAVWLAPLVSGLDGVAKSVVPVLFSGNPLDVSASSNMKKLVDLIQNKLIPFAALGPKVDVTATRVSETEQTDQIVEALRMIGAVR
ncbi:MlaD family protein [Nocardia sp. NPDC050713]|uniref:MlaD family protein n=1 Tax=Nocardia sp. NPDC050713 TaxID=3154511 RepID=UPI0033E75B03